ncbi:MAG: hypothetical protein HUK20_03940 [Fibrobacter sp.]|nr:hypothetical protein [Fibrobacter sp.]
MHRKTNNLKVLIAAAAAALFGACAGNTPTPQTTENAVPAQGEMKQPPSDEQISENITPILANSSSSTTEPSVESQTSETTSVEQASAAPSSSSKAPDLLDPYTAFPALADDVFKNADSLYKEGAIDAAVSYLKRFRIIKPLWVEWETRTDSMLAVYGQTNAERAKQFEPLVLQIQNMNRVQSAYSMVAATADSLIALFPGDSLVNFANEQKKIAYKNTLLKGHKEKTQILELAEKQAKFDEALKRAGELQMRYRDFEAELQTEALISHLQTLKGSVSEADKKYWEKNDPEAALAKVDTLIEKRKYDTARELLNKLKASPLRERALKKYQLLADAYCTAQRKTASQLYSKSTKQSDVQKKKRILQEAITNLHSCSDAYPDYEKIKTVTDNINFLQAEQQR